ncbi:MAG TPA: ChaN family lipoprotein [Prolixibacteraceae bacterium]|nr:ChaN family lipoprotein [Prolixibacteraceae bacterium]
MKKNTVIFLALFFLFTSFKPDKPAYLLFTAEGKSVKYSRMLKKLKGADVILFGESHSNPISHWLQLEVTKDLYKNKNGEVVLGAEMFEADNQLILNEYLDSLISQSRFENEARVWPNYNTDYKPLVEFARKNGIGFIATNIPRRYATIVNSRGFEGLEELSSEALKYLPPLPVLYDPELECYKSLAQMGGVHSHSGQNFPKAQAIKDATMAHFILKNWSPGKLFIHFNGSYHSDNYESIYWYLKQYNPDLNIVTITTVSQEDVSGLEEKNEGKADFIICVDDEMTQTR